MAAWLLMLVAYSSSRTHDCSPLDHTGCSLDAGPAYEVLASQAAYSLVALMGRRPSSLPEAGSSEGSTVGADTQSGSLAHSPASPRDSGSLQAHLESRRLLQPLRVVSGSFVWTSTLVVVGYIADFQSMRVCGDYLQLHRVRCSTTPGGE